MNTRTAPVKDLLVSVEHLLKAEQVEAAATLVQRCLTNIRGYNNWVELRDALQLHLKQKAVQHHPVFVKSYARALMGCDDVELAEKFITQEIPFQNQATVCVLEVELAEIELDHQQHQAALQRLTRIIPDLTGRDLGIAYSRLGKAQYRLQQENWFAAFQTMRQHLQGRDLGVQIVVEGSIWYYTNLDQAKNCYLEAIPLLESDPLTLAYTKSNLGLAYLLECDPQAHALLEAAAKQTRHVRFGAHRIVFLKNLAASHRVRGDWQNAVQKYKKALQLKPSAALALEILGNLGRTYRLARQPYQAEKTLLEALALANHKNLNANAANLELTALYLKKQQLDQAEQTLNAVQQLNSSDQQFFALLSAELARLQDQPYTPWLAQIPLQKRLAREEFDYWREFWADVQRLGHSIPQALPFMNRVVEIHPNSVWVSGEKRHLTPRSRRVLEFLLNRGKKTTRQCLQTEFFGNMTASSIKQTFLQFRRDLGWQESLILIGQKRHLDRRATWQDLRDTDADKMIAPKLEP